MLLGALSRLLSFLSKSPFFRKKFKAKATKKGKEANKVKEKPWDEPKVSFSKK